MKMLLKRKITLTLLVNGLILTMTLKLITLKEMNGNTPMKLLAKLKNITMIMNPNGNTPMKLLAKLKNIIMIMNPNGHTPMKLLAKLKNITMIMNPNGNILMKLLAKLKNIIMIMNPNVHILTITQLAKPLRDTLMEMTILNGKIMILPENKTTLMLAKKEEMDK